MNPSDKPNDETRWHLDKRVPVSIIVTLLLQAGAHAAQEVVAEAVSGDVRVSLTRDVGPCQGSARMFLFRRGVDAPLMGCYKPVQVGPQTIISINWLDGDRDMIPATEFKAPGGV